MINQNLCINWRLHENLYRQIYILTSDKLKPELQNKLYAELTEFFNTFHYNINININNSLKVPIDNSKVI